jgi:hypothetical protein
MHAKEAVWPVSLLCAISTLFELLGFSLPLLQLPRIRSRLPLFWLV